MRHPCCIGPRHVCILHFLARPKPQRHLCGLPVKEGPSIRGERNLSFDTPQPQNMQSSFLAAQLQRGTVFGQH